jgi:hypothetical protein
VAWGVAIEQFLIISPIVAYAAYFGLFGWTFWYVRRIKNADSAGNANNAGIGARAKHFNQDPMR